ncbi:lipoate--protein ligase [Oscillospiraceae bacterium OttesenSCG-928-G22]|nr:lipoate--protein ligase [Oscillospiraceae bacterium OttesenSCG-928-G22]
MYIAVFDSTDPFHNLAAEEYLLASKSDDFILLWQNDNTIVVGRHQNTAEEIDAAFVASHGIRVVRRNSGGGAVYHDLGNLNYTVIQTAKRGDRGFAFYVRHVLSALADLGVRAELSGRNDLLIDGRKISGVARYLRGDRIMYHGTLLLASDLSRIAGALRVKPEKFQSKSVKSVRSRVGNINDFLETPLTMDDFIAALVRSLTAGGGVLPYALTDDDRRKIERLQQTKYDTFAWNYGVSPASDTTAKRRFDGGTLEVHLSLREGCVSFFALRGDFLSLRDIEPLERALLGVPFTVDAFRDALSPFELSQYLGGITLDEFLSCVFD